MDVVDHVAHAAVVLSPARVRYPHLLGHPEGHLVQFMAALYPLGREEIGHRYVHDASQDGRAPLGMDDPKGIAQVGLVLLDTAHFQGIVEPEAEHDDLPPATDGVEGRLRPERIGIRRGTRVRLLVAENEILHQQADGGAVFDHPAGPQGHHGSGNGHADARAAHEAVAKNFYGHGE